MIRERTILLFTLLLTVSCTRSASDLVFKTKSQLQRGSKMQRGQAPLTYESLYKYILKPKCLSCHGAKDAKPVKDPIDFSTYETMMIDRFVPLLIKGKAFKSRLFESVDSGEMPEEGMLSAAEIDFIRKWINACAPKTEADIRTDGCKTPTDPGDGEPGEDDDEPDDDDDEPGDDDDEPSDGDEPL